MTHIEVDRVRPTELDSRFRGNDIAVKLFSVMPALRLRSGQAPAGIQDLLLLRVNANEIRSQFSLNHQRGWASLSLISPLRSAKAASLSTGVAPLVLSA